MLRGSGKLKGAGITSIVSSGVQIILYIIGLVAIINYKKDIELHQSYFRSDVYDETIRAYRITIVLCVIVMLYFVYKLIIGICALIYSHNSKKASMLFGNSIALLILDIVYTILTIISIVNTSKLSSTTDSSIYNTIGTILNLLFVCTDTAMIILLLVGSSQNNNNQTNSNSTTNAYAQSPSFSQAPYGQQPFGQPYHQPMYPNQQYYQPYPAQQMSGLRCQNCGKVNQPGNVYCLRCGKKMF